MRRFDSGPEANLGARRQIRRKRGAKPVVNDGFTARRKPVISKAHRHGAFRHPHPTTAVLDLDLDGIASPRRHRMERRVEKPDTAGAVGVGQGV